MESGALRMVLEKIYPTLYNECNYLSMLGLKFINVRKWGPVLRKSWGCPMKIEALYLMFSGNGKNIVEGIGTS